MKLIINKKYTSEEINLELDLETSVNRLFAILYSYRSKSYDHFSFNEYLQFISVYQCDLYAERFKNKFLANTKLSDYPLEDPCYLTWEEFTEKRHLFAHVESDRLGNKTLFWQTKLGEPEITKESVLDSQDNQMPGKP